MALRPASWPAPADARCTEPPPPGRLFFDEQRPGVLLAVEGLTLAEGT
jgi:hypothetical protein